MTSYMVVVGDPSAAGTPAERTVYDSEEKAAAAAFRVLCGALAVLGPLPIERVGSRGLALSGDDGAVLTIDVVACEDAATHLTTYHPELVITSGHTTADLLRVADQVTTAAIDAGCQVSLVDVLRELGARHERAAAFPQHDQAALRS